MKTVKKVKLVTRDGFHRYFSAKDIDFPRPVYFPKKPQILVETIKYPRQITNEAFTFVWTGEIIKGTAIYKEV